jgi:Flp pilus assembly pilin Flp
LAAASKTHAMTEEVAFTMIDYLKIWLELKTDRCAVTALEYALIAGVIVATILVGFNVLASDMSNSFNNIGNSL